MKHPLTFTGRLTGVLIALAVAWGCGDQSDTARKPKVIRKKITVAAKPQSPARKMPSRPSSGKASAPRPRSDIAKAKPPRSGPVSSDKAAAAPRKQLRPKSDIARQAVPAKPPTVVAQKTDRRPTPKSGTAATPASGAANTVLQPRSEPSAESPAATPAAKDKAKKSPATRKTPTAKKSQADKGKTAAKKKTPAKKKGPPEAYNPEGKIDPFKPLFQEKPDLPRKRTRRRIPRTPLEKLSLSQLKLTAIILAPSGNRALVQEASGKGYVIKNGTYIGLDGGKVVDIVKGRVIIEEEIEDIIGKLTKRKRELKLPKPAGDR